MGLLSFFWGGPADESGEVLSLSGFDARSPDLEVWFEIVEFDGYFAPLEARLVVDSKNPYIGVRFVLEGESLLFCVDLANGSSVGEGSLCLCCNGPFGFTFLCVERCEEQSSQRNR